MGCRPQAGPELVGGQSQEVVEEYMIHQYRFHQFYRTSIGCAGDRN
jgi:hypothetical protein